MQEFQGFWRIRNIWINPTEIAYAKLTETQTGPVLEVHLKIGATLAFTDPDDIAVLINRKNRKIFSTPD